MRRARALVIPVLVTTVLALAAGTACRASSDDALVVYSGRNEDLVRPILERFAEQTGIDIELRGGDSGELAAQIVTEGDASPADLFLSQDAGALGAVAKAGQFTTLPPSVLDQVPTWARSDDGEWVGISGRVRVVAHHEDVAAPPTTIDELVDEQWKGKVGFAPTNASWQSFVTGLRVLRGDDGARAWLEAFAANDPKAYPNNATVLDGIQNGEVKLGVVNHYYLYERVADLGDDEVDVANQFLEAGDPGGLVNVAGIGILTGSSAQDHARRLVEFLLGPEAQQYFADETKEFPLVAGVTPNDPNLPALASLSPPDIDLSDLDSIAQTQELLEATGLLTR